MKKQYIHDAILWEYYDKTKTNDDALIDDLIQVSFV